jgi:hypothetical protein
MTKKSFIFQVSGIILLMLVFLLSSCSQAAMNDQDQKNDEIKMSDSIKAGKVVKENDNKRYCVIPCIMEAQPGWNWCASSANCMMFLDPNCSWVNQTDLYKFKQYSELFPEKNAYDCINFYKNFHGYALPVTNTSLYSLARNGIDKNTLFINVRKISRPFYLTKFTIVIYGYDLAKNQVAYFNPHTGFCGWVDYNSILSGLNENGIYSEWSYMLGVTYDPSYYK